MSVEVKVPKKLIEVALPLDAINAAAAKEKSIRHGHPSTLHLWWARRPLAAARAVIFAQMVNDPGYERTLGRGVNREKAKIERERLFKIIEKLVLWESTTHESIWDEAHAEIRNSWIETCNLNKDHPEAKTLFNKEKIPAFYDPFAGGGAIPLEAERFGLDSFTSDLNPVAVLINKAMVEIPSRFRGTSPIGPLDKDMGEALRASWFGSNGLAEDVRRYGAILRERAFSKIGNLYPTVTVSAEMAKDRSDLNGLTGKDLKVIAWLWGRTVKSPNPAFSHSETPLVSSFVLSSKEHKKVWLSPIVKNGLVTFEIKNSVDHGSPPEDIESGTKLARGAKFKCLISGSLISEEYVREEFKAKRSGQMLLAIVAETSRGRIYLPPVKLHEDMGRKSTNSWRPEAEMNQDSKDLISGRGYGFHYWHELFTPRQLSLLTTYSDLIPEIVSQVYSDAVRSGLTNDGDSLEAGGSGAKAYSEAIGVYLALAVSKTSDAQSSLCRWKPSMDQSIASFGRQALPMVWDYSEANAFAEMAGDFWVTLHNMMKALEKAPNIGTGHVYQADARTQALSDRKIISTDPPYYDNVAYADLSDYFYIWLRGALINIFPKLFSAPAVPKSEELVALTYRHGSKSKAETFFLSGMKDVVSRLAKTAHPGFPMTIYYAFKQSETSETGTSSSGWETFLQAILESGLEITATWPMRTEMGNRMVSMGNNALASSIVLACRARAKSAPSISRREFLKELNVSLPEALEEMTRGGVASPVAPVDLSQAIIGPGMAVYSKYSAVLEADGSPMTVRTALQLINRFLTQDDFDHDTQFCVSWLDNHGWEKGKYGEADVLARAKGTSVDGLKEGGVVESNSGNLRLLRAAEMSPEWIPESDSRLSIWEILHQMIRNLTIGGETGAGVILAKCNQYSEQIRTLAYRLYTLCERKGWAQDAGQYNSLVVAWDAIEAAAREIGYSGTQRSLFEMLESTETTQNETKKKKEKRKKE